jgi:hypothetical protein
MVSFDEEAAYDEEISPLMSKVIAICKAKGIPMVAVFQFAGRDDEASFCTTTIPKPDDRVHPHIKNLAKIAAEERNRTGPFAMAITETTTPEGVHLTFKRIS